MASDERADEQQSQSAQSAQPRRSTSEIHEFITETVLQTFQHRIPAKISTLISAEDIAQETCVKIFESGKATDDLSPPYVKAVAQRALIDELRKSEAQRRSPGNAAILRDTGKSSVLYLPNIPGKESTPSKLEIRLEIKSQIWEIAKAELNDLEFQIFDLRYGFDLSNEETAQLLDKTKNSIRNIDFRIRNKLAVCLRRVPDLESRVERVSSTQDLDTVENVE